MPGPAAPDAGSRPTGGQTGSANRDAASTGGVGGQGGSAGSGSGGAPAPAADAGAGGTGGAAPAVTDIHGTVPQGGGVKGSGAAFEDRLYKYDFTLTPDAWNSLNVNALANASSNPRKYVPAVLKIDGMPAVPGDGMIGLRYKGASTLADCVKVTDFNQRKCSFKVSFDELHPGDKTFRFHGLKKVNLHSLQEDPSALSEKLGYRLFREMGIATARVTHAWVTVNGVAKGLFTVVENVTDGRFTEDKWPGDPNGNLYKQAWPGRLASSTTKGYYDDKLETNTDAVPPVTHDQILAFANDLKKNTIPAVNPAGLFDTLKKWSDPEWMARLLAVDTLILDHDGPAQLVCRSTQCNAPFAYDYSNHNYLWYQTQDNKFLLVPWDLNDTWGVNMTATELSTAITNSWDLMPSATLAQCTTYRYKAPGGQSTYSQCDPIYKAANQMRSLYVKAVKDMLAGPYNVARLTKDIDDWNARYLMDAVMKDPKMDPAGYPARIARFKMLLAQHADRMKQVQ